MPQEVALSVSILP